MKGKTLILHDPEKGDVRITGVATPRGEQLVVMTTTEWEEQRRRDFTRGIEYGDCDQQWTPQDIQEQFDDYIKQEEKCQSETKKED